MDKELVQHERKTYYRNYIFDGILLVLLGLAMLIWPDKALKVLCYFTGGLIAVMGLIRLAIFMFNEKNNRKVFDLAVGIFQLALGFSLILAVDFFVSLFFVVTGLILAYGAFLMFYRAFQLRKDGGSMFVLSLVFAIITLIFTVIVIINPPAFADFATHIQGAALIIEGLGMTIVLKNYKVTMQKEVTITEQ